MKWLVDSNIVMYAEPTTSSADEELTKLSIEIFKLVQELGHSVCLHPHIAYDIARDADVERSAVFQKRADRYVLLESFPSVEGKILETLGEVREESNDWVDNHLLAAVYYDAVSCLITNDKGIISKAYELDVRHRVYSLTEAVHVLRALLDKEVSLPPQVSRIKAFELDSEDEIFETLRADYKHFDDWLSRCKQDGRECFVIKELDNQRLSGVCILKKEEDSGLGLKGKVLKLCTFKTSNAYAGQRSCL